MKPESPTPSREQDAYLDALEQRVDAYIAWQAEMERITAEVNEGTRRLLEEGPPRSTCPGCFSAIYDGARRQGWCCDCFPQRHRYEKAAYGH